MNKKSFSPIKKIIISALLLLVILVLYSFINKFLGVEIAFIVSMLCFFYAQFLILYSFYDFIKWPQKKWIKLLLGTLCYSLYTNFLQSFLFPIFRAGYCQDCSEYQLIAAYFLGIQVIQFLVFVYLAFTLGAILYDLGRYFISKTRLHKNKKL